MMRSLIAVALLAATVAPAAAQQVCANRDVLVQSLSQDYSESPRAVGVSNDGNVIELLTTGDGQTWTLLLTMPDGTSCVLAAGEGWESLPQLVAGRDA